jgi:hypothetical protein
MIIPLPRYRYIGSLKELPESAEENDIILVGSSLYLWHDTWHEIINYEENLLSKITKVVREARDSKLKRELEKLIEEENING